MIHNTLPARSALSPTATSCEVSSGWWLGLLLGACLLHQPATAAADWPQILGPNRSGVSKDTRLTRQWPDAGPEMVWEHEVGEGYAGAAVAGNQVLVFHRQGNEEVLESLRLETGEQQWGKSYPANYQGGINSDTGPRCVPLIHQGQVFTMGPSGKLRAVRLEDGAPIWTRDVYGEFRANEGYFGAGSTPIVVGEKLLLNVGGRLPKSGIIAFRLADGAVEWQIGNDQASYSSPIRLPFGEREAVAFVTRLHAVIVDPETGEELSRMAFGARSPTVNAATPLLCDGKLFLTASYGVGGRMERLDNGQLKNVWQNDDSMSSQYTTSVYIDGYLYGTHGREDLGTGELRCVAADTGRVIWRQPDFGLAHLIRAGNLLLIQTVDGELALAEASPKGYRELQRTRLFRGPSRALPALSAGQLITRSNAVRGQGQLRCYQVGTAIE